MQVPYSINAYTRVLKLASTPDWEEFSRISLIAAAGIFLIGFIGFLIFLIMSVLPGG
ncbi:MAG: protein translocase SEC61 complex subunit gamma [Halodesulfurarchaeum sp.]